MKLMLMAKNWLNNISGVNKKEQIKLLRCETDKKGRVNCPPVVLFSGRVTVAWRHWAFVREEKLVVRWQWVFLKKIIVLSNENDEM